MTWNRQKKKTGPSYASLPRTMLASHRVRNMTGLGIRVLLTAHARWRGRPPLLLPTKTVPVMLGIERAQFARGRTEVIAANLLEQTRAHIPPGGAGSATAGVRRAAEFNIPHAHKGATVPLDPGDKRLPGYWRIMSADLEKIVGVTQGQGGRFPQFVTDDQLRVVIALVQGPRTTDGALDNPTQQPISVRAIVEFLPGLTLRTVQRALTALVTLGLASKVGGGTGRAPAQYEPAGLLVGGVPQRRARRQ
jgi:hypothetical protein